MNRSGFPSAEATETAFYAAFESADYAAMMAAWSTETDVECIHPLGERLMGPKAVADGWRRVLAGGKRMQFRLAHAKRFQADCLAIHVLYENITIAGKPQPPVVSTNIYRFNGQGWQMIFHHASPATGIGRTNSADGAAAAATVVH